MKIHKKILVLVLAAFLLTSLTVRSETASNVIEFTDGIGITGDIYQNEVLGTVKFTLDKQWHDPTYDVDLVEMTRDFVHTPPLDPILNVSREIVTSLVFKNNRTVFMPAVNYHVESGEDTVIVFIDFAGSLEFTSDDFKVTYNGTTYIVEDLDTESPVYLIVGQWLFSWAFGNVFELQLMPQTKYIISPLATTGQLIDYGPYQGEVIGFAEYYISDEEYYEVIEVHHNQVVVNINIFGDVTPYTIGESTLFYEKQTGMIVNWIEYNATTEEYYYFNATEITGIQPIQETSASFIVVLSTVLIAIPIVLAKRRKK